MSPVYIDHEPNALVVRFEREGEAAQVHRVRGGKAAMAKALGMLLTRHPRLQVGDRLTVKSD